LSTLSSLTRSLAGLSLGGSVIHVKPLLPSGGLAQGLLVTQVRGWKNLVEPHRVFPQRNYEKKNPENGRYEMAKDGHGVTLIDLEDGERKNLSPVVMRFKRLEWGAWIRPRGGRNKKLWKKDQTKLIEGEKHVFCKHYHRKRFDRAVTTEYKEARYIPDDPYKVYNEMSWQNYHSIKLKNMNLIKKYGAKNYNFPKFVAHYHKDVRYYQKDRNPFYEPPGYHNDIHTGIYSPDLDRPQDIMPPDYDYKRRFHSQAAINKEKRYWRRIRRYEKISGTRVSPCSSLRLPVVGTELG